MEENYFTRLNMLLKSNGFTVKYLLESTGISETSYHSLLRYDNCPRADKAVEIAKLLNTTVEYMVTGETNGKIPPDVLDSVRLLMTLDRAHRSPILANIKSQVEYWGGASSDILPETPEENIPVGDKELLDNFHSLSERDRTIVTSLISSLKSN